MRGGISSFLDGDESTTAEVVKSQTRGGLISVITGDSVWPPRLGKKGNATSSCRTMQM
jgi:hypothetical protein